MGEECSRLCKGKVAQWQLGQGAERRAGQEKGLSMTVREGARLVCGMPARTASHCFKQ